MRYLIKNAKIIAPGSSHNNKKLDILISNGIISEISKNIVDEKASIITSKNLHVSIGWMDVGTHLGEPGYENRESIKSLCQAALAGGYTDIAPMPSAAPTIQTKAQITSLKNDSNSYGIDMYPMGALSIDSKGENIAEYMDMKSAGVNTFTDGLKSVKKNGLLLRALQYAKGGDSLIMHHPTDSTLDNGNQVHEGIVSIKMGIKGSPEVAEHLMVDRDIQLASYTESKICIHCLSSKGSIDRVKKAKEKQYPITASVSYMNLIATETDMLDFDTNYKVKPVLRTETDRKSLVKALKNNTIDFISSNHNPLEPEAKILEFPYAECGATGLETVYASLNTYLKDQISSAEFVSLVAIGPRRVLDMEIPNITVGEKAKLTCWDSQKEWIYTCKNKKSKSANNPFIDKPLVGKIIATINGKTTYISD